MQEGSRRERIPLDVFLKRSWPLIALGAVLILFVSGLLLWYAVSGTGRTAPHASAPVEGSATSTSATSTLTLVPRSLDGVLVEPTLAHLLPFAVMIDNQPDARPESGLAEASLVFESPVEGGLTRYMAVFDSSSTVDQIGPVRSARPYFVDWANGLGALYAHVGGSPDALDYIKSMPAFHNVDQFFNGSTFWRSAKRVAPHNTYTRSDLLLSLAQAKNWRPAQWHAWDYKDDDALSATSTAQGATLTTSSSTTKTVKVKTTTVLRGGAAGPSIAYNGDTNVAWQFDKTNDTYIRVMNGAQYTDLDGMQVRAHNIVVLLTDSQTLDSEGRLKVRTTGRGSALLYRDGDVLPVTWFRSTGGQISFESVDGTNVTFNRGTTWIEVVASSVLFQGLKGK